MFWFVRVGVRVFVGFVRVGVCVLAYRTTCLAAIWGMSRKLKSPEAVWTLFVLGQHVDPKHRVAYRCFRMLRRMLTRFGALRSQVASVLGCYGSGARRVPGPVGVMSSVCDLLDWRSVDLCCFGRPNLPNLHLLGGPDGWCDHQVREGMRLAEWKRVAARRDDSMGMECHAGVDMEATTAWLQSRELSQERKGLLRSILSGSVRLGEGLHKAGLWQSATCPFCKLETESLAHCFWWCLA